MKLHHAALICNSEEKADRFYGEIVGLKKIKTSMLDQTLTEQIFGKSMECRIILYGNDHFSIEVFIAKKPPTRDDAFEHVCLETAQREAFLTKCESRGLPVKRIPKGDKILAFVEDYDGNLFEVKES